MVMALAPGARLCHGHQLETFNASTRFGNGVALRTRCTPSLGGARPKHSLVISSLLGGGKQSEDIGSSDEQKKAGLFRNIEGLYDTVQEQKQEFYTVGDFMTPASELLVAKKSTTLDEALEALVDNRITGMPVVDDDGKLIGVVSDYDLLALDSISGKPPAEMGLFPEPGRTWKAFKEIQKLLIKTHGKTVGEVMTPSPLVVREMTNLEDAARLLLDSKYRRLPVVDDGGKLVGLLTRGNVVRAALQMKRAAVKVYKESRP